MSVAFTREDSAQTAQEVSLPERPISPHPNLVTRAGYEAVERALAESSAALEAARRIEDSAERHRAVELALRDMRYFAERLRGAQVQPAPLRFESAAFGHRIVFARDRERPQTYRIVGEDEADPRGGSISYVSPMARALIGKRVGDVVDLNGREIEILAIE